MKKTFEIGSTCMINDYHVAEDVRKYIEENKISHLKSLRQIYDKKNPACAESPD